jgi:probable F420-dependent oxidoreductase
MTDHTSVVPEGRLVYGMQLPVQSQSRTFAEPWEHGAGPDELLAVARHADVTGFFYVAVCDHVGVPAGPQAEHMTTTWYDTIATLGVLAGVTSTVRLLSSVYVPAYRHPLQTAKAFATLDRLSGGRVILGVGAGHLRAEFDAFGVPYDERGAITNEAIDCIRAAFTDEFPEFTGTRFRSESLGIGPRPVQPRIPIWIGGRKKPALRRVAERGDGWLPQGTPRHELAGEIAVILEHRKRVAEGAPLDLGFLAEPVYVGTPSWDVGRYCVHGTPEQLAASTRAVRDLGVNHVQIKLRSRSVDELLDQMSAWHEQVAPLLNA